MPDVETVQRLIPAPPEAIFSLLADPRRHHDIDGSGSVREATGDPEELKLGSRFGMSMRLGIPYTTVNTVVEYDAGRRIAWQTKPHGVLGRVGGGRIWRYELEPVEGGTMVRESWDISQEARMLKPIVKRAATVTRKNMAATLERIERLVAG